MEAQRLDEAVDDPLSNHANFDNDADYDADASRVQAVVNANPLALEEGEEEEMAVPTEYLQEDLGIRLVQEDLRNVKTVGDLIAVCAPRL